MDGCHGRCCANLAIPGRLLQTMGVPHCLEVPAFVNIFSKKKMNSHKNNQKISCQARECWSMFPIIRHFVHSVAIPQGHWPEGCQSLLAQAEFIDQVFDGNRSGLISKSTLLPVVEKAIAAFQTAFPEVPLIKKWHWLLHMPDSYERFGNLVACFANERKHKPLGALMASTTNTTNFCKNLMEQALSKEVCALDEPAIFKDGVYLVQEVQASTKTLQTLTTLIGEPVLAARSSQCASVNHVPCHKDDVVIYKEGAHQMRVGQIHLHFLLNDIITTLVKAWDVQQWAPTMQLAICRVSESNSIFFPQLLS